MELTTVRDLRSRGRSNDFASALDALDRPGWGRIPHTPMTGLAGRLAAAGDTLAPAAATRPEFRAALRTRLVAMAAVQAPVPVGAPTRTPRIVRGGRAQRTLGVTTGALACVVALGGVAAAGDQSLPGDPFYGAKRGTEALRLTLARSEMDRGRQHLEFATTRLREVRGLTLGRDAFENGSTDAADIASLDPGVAVLVRQTLADMDAETRRGTALLTSAFRSSQADAPLRTLSLFATRQSDSLERLLPALPPTSQDRGEASLALVADLADETGELLELGTCTTDCEPATSTASPSPSSSPSSSPSPSPTVEATPTPTVTPSPEASPSPGGDEPTSPGPSSQPLDPVLPATSPGATGTDPLPLLRMPSRLTSPLGGR